MEINKMPEFCMIFAQNISPNFGQLPSPPPPPDKLPPSPVSYAYAALRFRSHAAVLWGIGEHCRLLAYLMLSFSVIILL